MYESGHQRAVSLNMSSAHGTRPVEISVVEDNPPDVAWLKMMLNEAGLCHHITVAEDGEQAVDCLLRRGRYAGCPTADLIFLDMNLPKFGGLEILYRVPGSECLPVCILSSSKAEEGLVRAHFGRPVGYLTKPVSAAALLECLQVYNLPDH
jgi:CheY-like chemotaxis protein